MLSVLFYVLFLLLVEKYRHTVLRNCWKRGDCKGTTVRILPKLRQQKSDTLFNVCGEIHMLLADSLKCPFRFVQCCNVSIDSAHYPELYLDFCLLQHVMRDLRHIPDVIIIGHICCKKITHPVFTSTRLRSW